MYNYLNHITHTVFQKFLLPLLVTGFLTAASANTPANISGQIKLTLFGNGTSDNTTIGFNAGATAGYDASYDALKATVSNSLNPYIACVNNSNDFQSNYYACGKATYAIPLRVKQGVAGKCVLIRDSALNLPAQTCMFLEDLSTGVFEDFIAGSSYSFTISDTTTAPMFVLHIMTAIDHSVAQPACSYSGNGAIYVQAPSAGSWNLVLKNAIGNSLFTHNAISGTDSLKNLTPGNYTAELTGNIAFCPTFSDSIQINVPATLQVNAIVGSVQCNYSNNGFINATAVSGGTAPYTYQWSNMQSTATISSLYKGVYTLIVSDANSCTDTSVFTVNSLSNLTADFSTNADTLLLPNATLYTTNNSVAYTNVVWNFGDGSNTGTQINPAHTYTAGGVYLVELTASDNTCSQTVQKTVVVSGFSGIAENTLNEHIDVNYYDNAVQVKFDMQKSTTATITVYDVSGKIIQAHTSEVMNTTETLELNAQESMYVVEVKTTTSQLVKKIIAIKM